MDWSLKVSTLNNSFSHNEFSPTGQRFSDGCPPDGINSYIHGIYCYIALPLLWQEMSLNVPGQHSECN